MAAEFVDASFHVFAARSQRLVEVMFSGRYFSEQKTQKRFPNFGDFSDKYKFVNARAAGTVILTVLEFQGGIYLFTKISLTQNFLSFP